MTIHAFRLLVGGGFVALDAREAVDRFRLLPLFEPMLILWMVWMTVAARVITTAVWY